MAKQPEIVGDVWFNTKPLRSKDLRGKVVLVDFWTYSCVNCLRTIPHLRQWWGRFKDKPFVLLGVHSPEFDFEKDPANVKKALEELGIEWPVVLDNDFVNWRNFSNQYWPAKYLVDQNGEIVYTHFGEGGYNTTEAKIAALLGEKVSSAAAKTATEEEPGNACFVTTPELYCGYGRGQLGNTAGYARDELARYVRPGKMEDDVIALSGQWLATKEYVESQEAGAGLWLTFRATEVNLVLKPRDRVSTITIKVDGQAPTDLVRGLDVDDKGIVRVTEPRMYNLLRSDDLISRPNLDESILSLEAADGAFQAFAFTFSGCKDIVRTG